MPLMSWGPQFSVGIDEIDTQHQELLKLLNKMFDAMQQGKTKDVMSNILNDLISYTASHFATEERYFKLYNYPDTEEHITEHSNLVVKVKDFQKNFNSGNTTIGSELLFFLKDWLMNHILGCDKRYSSFLISKGLN